MGAKTFLYSFLASAALVLTAVAGFNWVVDPIRLFEPPVVERLNLHKPLWFFGQLISKPYAIRRQQPDALLLGTSRAGVTLDPRHPAWRGYRPYNAALAGTSTRVHYHSFEHARAQGVLRRVLLGLDLFSFNSCRDQRRELPERDFLERLSQPPGVNWSFPGRSLVDHATALLALDSTRKSWRTWRSQPLYASGQGGLLDARADGFWYGEFAEGTRQRQVFRAIERQYVALDWFPPPAKCYSLYSEGSPSQLDYFERLLRSAHANDTQLILYFSPFHARLGEAMDAVELWDDFEQLKREVLHLNESVARAAGGSPFAVWDFSGYNAVTTERVPAADDASSRMHWFIDGTHGSLALGNLVQDSIFDRSPAVPGFGVRLDADNLEQQLERTRKARDVYRAKFPGEVREVRRLVDRVRNRG
jgi:hypothetical protein